MMEGKKGGMIETETEAGIGIGTGIGIGMGGICKDKNKGKRESKRKSKDKSKDKSKNKEVDVDTDVDTDVDIDIEKFLALPEGYSLYKHQIEALEWMINREKGKGKFPGDKIKGGILSLTMGLGKTLISCSLCMLDDYMKGTKTKKEGSGEEKEKEKGEYNKGKIIENFPNLVICSKTVAYEWKRNIDKFFPGKCPYLYFYRGDLGKEFDSITIDDIMKYKIIITTYETITSMAKKCDIVNSQFIYSDKMKIIGFKPRANPIKKFTELINTRNDEKLRGDENTGKELEGKELKGGNLLFSIPWNRIIADESHRFANPKSITYYSIMCLYGDKKWCLSGTPLRNYSTDVYSQLRFCGYDKITHPSAFEYKLYIQDKLDKCIMYKDYDDAGIKLPKLHEHIINVELDGHERDIYNYFHGETKRIYKEFLMGNFEFSCLLTMFLRLRQICVCPCTILSTEILDQRDSILRLLEGKEEKELDEGLNKELTEEKIITPNENGNDIEERNELDRLYTSYIEEKKRKIKDRRENRREKSKEIEREMEIERNGNEGEGVKINVNIKTKGKNINDEKYSDIDLEDNKDEKDNEGQYSGLNLIKGLTPEAREWITDVYGSAGIDSVKMATIIDIIKNVNPKDKIIIFTSFTRVIEILKISLSEKIPDRKYLFIHGGIVGEERNSIIDKFKTSKKDNILFMSYKVGSEGLNLIEATHIIMCENWWTPVVQEQAKARAHRIGQEKEVHIWKLISKKSIEDRIEEICKEKIKLMNDFITEKGKGKSEGGKNMDKRIRLDAGTIGRIIS